MTSLKPVADLNRHPTRFLAVLVVPALFVLTSCGTDDGLGKRYPVSGTVTYNDKPLEKGEISFVTEDLTKNFGASGAIKDGSYTLSMGGDGDGAQAGKYKVTISSKEDYIEKAQEASQKALGNSSPKPLPNLAAKAEAEAKSLIPLGYGDLRTTTLTAEVKPEGPNTFKFDLSDASAPPDPPKSAAGKAGRGKKGH